MESPRSASSSSAGAAGGDTGAIEEIARQADDSLDQAALDEVPPNVRIFVAAEENPVGKNDRGLARTLQRPDDVKQERVVAVLWRGNAVFEPFEFVLGRVEAVGPCFSGEGWICDGEVEGRETAIAVLEVGRGECVALPQLGSGVAVKEHVHASHRPRGKVILLTVDAHTVRGLVGRFQQERTRTAGWVIDRLVRTRAGPMPTTLAKMRETSAGV